MNENANDKPRAPASPAPESQTPPAEIAPGEEEAIVSSEAHGPDLPQDRGALITAPTRESDLDIYPLRTPHEDPGWAIKMVWVWVFFAVGAILFMVALLVLGIWYD